MRAAGARAAADSEAWLAGQRVAAEKAALQAQLDEAAEARLGAALCWIEAHCLWSQIDDVLRVGIRRPNRGRGWGRRLGGAWLVTTTAVTSSRDLKAQDAA